jgi:hypothetical protein
LPDGHGFAMGSPDALRAANRKTGIVMPEKQNQKPTNGTPLARSLHCAF